MSATGSTADRQDVARTCARVVPLEEIEARVRAAAILEEAERAAAAVRSGAADGAERARSAAREEGLADGRARGAAEALERASRLDRELSTLREELLDLACAMAGRILRREVEAGRDAGALLEPVLTRIGDATRVVLRVAPGDVEAVEGVLAGRHLSSAVRLVADGALSRGDVVAETGAGMVDGRIATRLDLLRRALGDGSGAGGGEVAR